MRLIFLMILAFMVGCGGDGNSDGIDAGGNAPRIDASGGGNIDAGGGGGNIDAGGGGGNIDAGGGGACPFTGASACQECIQTTCADETNTCIANPACFSLIQCASNCGEDLDCINACVLANPDGEADFNAFLTCASEDCAACCGG